jgi:negative regulator of flagellin synthesis FlgM
MKIDPDNKAAKAAPVGHERGAVDGGKAKAAAGGATAAPAAPGEAGTTVELSVSAAAVAAAGAEFDAEKVERIAQEIREGRYKINAEAIADKLIANAQEALKRAKG